jgi:uncharacterized repeat protein (TIGR01451 family)
MKRLHSSKRHQQQWLISSIIASGTIAITAPAALADITPSLIFNPPNVTQGSRSRLTLTLGNDSLTPVNGLQFNNTLPAGARLSPTPIVSNSCNGILTAAPLATSFSLTGGNIAPLANGIDGECQIVLELIGIAGGNQIVSFAPNDITSTTGNNSQGAQATLQVAGLGKIGTVITFGPTLIPQSSSSRMTVRLNNPNSVTLTGADLTSALPAGLRIRGTTFTSNTCGGSLIPQPAPPAIPTGFQLDNASIPSGGCEFSWEIEGDLPPTASQQDFVYAIAADQITTDQFVSNDAGSGTLRIQQGLRVEQQLSRTSANPQTANEGGTLQVFAGETARLTLQLSNAGGALTNISLTQNLPAGLEIADNVTSTTCGGMTITAVPGATSFTISGGNLAAATPTALANCLARVNVRAAAAGTYTNTINVGTISSQSGAGTSNNLNSSNITLQVSNTAPVGGVGLSSGIRFAGNMNSAFYASNAISAGNIARMEISVTNNSGVILSGVGFGAAGVALPAGVRLAAAPNITTTCAGGTATFTADVTPGIDAIFLSGGNLDRRQTCRVFVSVVSDTPNTYTGVTIANTFVSQNASNAAETYTNSAGSGQLIVLDYINFEQYFIPTSVAASTSGNPARMRLRLTNAALAASGGTRLRFNLAGGLRLRGGVLSNSCGGTLTLPVDGTIFDLTGATIPAATGQVLADDGACEIEYEVLASGSPGTITNTIPVGALVNAANQSNRTPVSAELTLSPVNVVVNQQVINVTPGDPNNGQPIVTGGEPAELRVTLTNNSGIPLTNLNYANIFPPDVLVYTVPSPQPGSCTGATINATPENNQYNVSGISLAPNTNCTLTLQITSLTSSNRDITIAIRDIQSNEGGTNSQASIVTLTTRANATVSKSFNPTSIAAGGTSRLTLKVVNANITPITRVELPDVFPTGMLIADTPVVTNNCGGTVNAAPGADRVVLVGGNLRASSICTIEVNVTALTAQPYLNTIPRNSLITAEGRTNLRDIQATLDVTGSSIVRPGLRLVKRITQIINQTGTTPEVIDLSNRVENFTPTTGRDDDNAPNWPAPIDATAGISNFLRGVYNGSQIAAQGLVKAGSTIEYAGYFLSDGTGVANNAQLCDYLPANTEYVANSLTAQLGNGTALTGQFLPPGSAFPTACRGTNNSAGAVVVNLGNVTNATGVGTPNNSYGSFRFRVTVR